MYGWKSVFFAERGEATFLYGTGITIAFGENVDKEINTLKYLNKNINKI